MGPKGKQKQRDGGVSACEQIQTNTSKKASRSTPFQDGHVLEYGLKIVERNPITRAVASVACQFCVKHGREAKLGARAPTANVKCFTAPFRPEQYRQHLVRQHTHAYEEYRRLSQPEKRLFFAGEQHSDTLHHYYGGRQVKMRCVIDASVVNNIIGQLIFAVSSDEGSSWTRVLASFDHDVETGNFFIDISNRAQFDLVIGYISRGCSFRQAESLFDLTKKITGLATLGSCPSGLPTKYARFACAMNLQKLKQVLATVWTFSIAIDMSTHMSTSYLDIRIRFEHGGRLYNFHVLALPFSDRHTAAAIFDTTSKALGVMCPDWKSVLLSISTDGERKMTGQVKGVATRFLSVTKPGFIRVWCGLHQLDLVMQIAFKTIMNSEFYAFLVGLIGYLRRQQNLIAQMKTKVPLLADTRWESMGKVASWFKHHRIDVINYLTSKQVACSPPRTWWIVLMVVEKIANRASITFKCLQGAVTLMTKQRHEMRSFAHDIGLLIGVQYIDDEQNLLDYADTSDHVISTYGRYAATLSSVNDFLEDMGSFVLETMGLLEDDVIHSLLVDIGKVIVNLVSGVHVLEAERDEQNSPAGGNAIPVLVHQLVKVRGRDFAVMTSMHRDRMRSRWTDAQIDKIEQDHAALVELYNSDTYQRKQIDKSDDTTEFEESWSVVRGRFGYLCRFAGGLATVFPGTSSVESDFSILKWGKPTTKLSDKFLTRGAHSCETVRTDQRYQA